MPAVKQGTTVPQTRACSACPPCVSWIFCFITLFLGQNRDILFLKTLACGFWVCVINNCILPHALAFFGPIPDQGWVPTFKKSLKSKHYFVASNSLRMRCSTSCSYTGNAPIIIHVFANFQYKIRINTPIFVRRLIIPYTTQNNHYSGRCHSWNARRRGNVFRTRRGEFFNQLVR